MRLTVVANADMIINSTVK